MARFLALVILLVALSPLVASDQRFRSPGAVPFSDRSPTDPPAGNVDGEAQLMLVDIARGVEVTIMLTGSLEADFSQARALVDRAAAAGWPHVSDELLRAQLLTAYICQIDGRRTGCGTSVSH